MSEAVVPDVFLKLDTGTHTGDIVQIIATPDGKKLISAGDSSIRVWDAATRLPLRLLLGEGAGDVVRMALSPADGRTLVVLRFRVDAGQRRRRRASAEVQVFDIETGALQASFLSNTSDVDFSPDGRYLAMTGLWGRVQVFAARDVLKAGFDREPVPLAETRFARNARFFVKTAVRFIPAPRHRSEPYALVVAVQLARGADSDGMLHWLRFAPDTGLRRVRKAGAEAMIMPSTLSVNDEWAVVAAQGTVERGRQAMGRVLLHSHEGHVRDCLFTEAPPASTAFAPTGFRLLVGLSAPQEDDPGQHILPVQSFAVSCLGFERRSIYHGHDYSVCALAFLADDLAVTAGGDNQSIHFWDGTGQVGQLQAVIRGVGRAVFGAHVNRTGQLVFSTVPDRLMPAQGVGRLGTFCLKSFGLGSTDLHKLRAEPFNRARGRWVTQGLSGRSQLVGLYCGQDDPVEQANRPPDLSLFIGSDDEWVIWTRSGYYDASPLGARRMGYQVNRGMRKAALFLRSDRFKDFKRPDIVRAVILHGSEARAIAAGVLIAPLDVAGLLPPVIELQSAQVAPDQREVRLRFSVQPLVPGGAVTRVWILRNDRFAWTQAQPGPVLRRQFDIKVPLGPGRNVVSLRAENASGRALAVDCEFQGPKPAAPGTVAADASGKLYLLSVGVSRFQAEGTPLALQFDLKPLKCAHRDAIAVYNALACSAMSAEVQPRRPLRNRAFDAVHAHLLVNEQATKQAIRDALLDLCQAIQKRGQAPGAERDVLVLFLAGHGVQVVGDRDLYFLNCDSDLQREDTGLSLLEVGEMLATVPAEVVVLIDACHSGMAGNGIDRGIGPDEVAQRLQEVSERSMYVLSAARADELAREGDAQGHGVFTGALLATLNSRKYLVADPGGKTESLNMTSLMAGLQAEMPRITQRLGKASQTPVFRTFGDVLPLTIYRR